MLTGYGRVSTLDQDLEVQVDLLASLGVAPERIYTDHGLSGSRLDRPGLAQALASVREGDVLVVQRLDRLGRSTKDLLEIVETLHERGVGLQVGSTVYDWADPLSRLLLTVLSMVAEFESGLIRTRTREAMSRESVRAKLKGRAPRTTPAVDAQIFRLLQGGEHSVAEIGAMFGGAGKPLSRPTVYRAAQRHRLATGQAEQPLVATA